MQCVPNESRFAFSRRLAWPLACCLHQFTLISSVNGAPPLRPLEKRLPNSYISSSGITVLTDPSRASNGARYAAPFCHTGSGRRNGCAGGPTKTWAPRPARRPKHACEHCVTAPVSPLHLRFALISEPNFSFDLSLSVAALPNPANNASSFWSSRIKIRASALAPRLTSTATVGHVTLWHWKTGPPTMSRKWRQ